MNAPPLNAADVMTANPVTVRPEAALGEAVALLVEKRISGLPVLDADGKLVGILTESDLLRRGETGTEREPRWLEMLFAQPRLAAEYVHAHSRSVADVMTRDVLSVTADAPLEVVVGLMEKRGVRRLPVLDRAGGRLVGIISRADLMRALRRVLAERPGVAADDAAIRERILAEIAAQPWAPSMRNIGVAVTGGKATLSGVILHDEQRRALNVLVAGVPGVTSVDDQLAWFEPVTGGIIPG
jgi:CBS domain-containing protein